ncbi:MAG: CpcT/CpeT family chromophore lyase [Cyanobacteriota bacterium]|nr:CpcT/CpeT family chromophore lyase [Cyanobacteriota bacterium]
MNEVTRWFTGNFDNSSQVANNPRVPLIDLSTCSVELAGGNQAANTQNLYLKQQSDVFERNSFYSFSEGNNIVNLGVRSVINPEVLSGICNRPKSERIVNFSNLVPVSCDLEIAYEPDFYTGNNAPDGCPTSSGGKVVSKVTIRENSIDALDQIFNFQGDLIVNTPIEYRRITSVPEPKMIFGLLAISLWSAKKVISQKQSKK